MDRTLWHNCLVTKISRHHSTGFFFLWGYYVKHKVYSKEIRDVEDLRASITAAIATVTTEIAQRTWLELDYRLNILRATKEAHMAVH
ncbi:hypothetical protein AVEN_88082-1 [Araneus ventricosus]|uniref:Uncharacterized protein n=1 Tax=Araneus ventricosus TaxID=182803 RepID=A0A4Y2ARW6_ARAVE|nr:hypothetical protein AVEN_88082-1 [Araneus ventricosus]